MAACTGFAADERAKRVASHQLSHSAYSRSHLHWLYISHRAPHARRSWSSRASACVAREGFMRAPARRLAVDVRLSVLAYSAFCPARGGGFKGGGRGGLAPWLGRGSLRVKSLAQERRGVPSFLDARWQMKIVQMVENLFTQSSALVRSKVDTANR